MRGPSLFDVYGLAVSQLPRCDRLSPAQPPSSIALGCVPQPPHAVSEDQPAPYVRYPPSVIYALPHMHKCHNRDNDLDKH